MKLCAYEGRFPKRPVEVIKFFRGRLQVIVCVVADMCAGKQAQVFWKSSNPSSK